MIDGGDDNIDGIIKSILVRNFLCHDEFQIDFDKNVTYVVGCNGSGKSALVTALVVGLGGKAAMTNRGSRMTSFIKRGADSASVTLKIKNSGPMAYKHEEYGDTIIVTHDFSLSGSSTYKVKSESGQLISTKHQEVQDIVHAHNIQVDNPISVLNQDEARTFFTNKPHDNYIFFRKATNLDKTERNYNNTLDLCKKANDKLEAKKNAAKHLEEEYNRLDKLNNIMMSRGAIEQQKKALENEYYWSELAELEHAMEEKVERHRQDGEKVARLEAELERLTARADAELQTERKLPAAAEERRAAEQQQQEAQRALAAGEAGARRREQAARDLRTRRALEQRKLDDLSAEIQNIESGGNAAAREELAASVAAGEAAGEAARARLATAEHAAEQARRSAARARDLAEEARDRLPPLRAAAEEARRQLRSLQRAGAEPLAVFGPEMAELRRRVDAAVARGEFAERPRGPVGAHVKMRDPQWGGALEHILGQHILSFCATNGRDARRLKAIIAEVYRGRGRPPSVSYSAFRAHAHDVQRSSVCVPDMVSALGAVRVDDPVIENFLIDNLSLETVLLAPDNDVAMKLTSKGPAPAHLWRVVTRNCTEFFPAPNYRSYGGRARKVRYLHQDLADRHRQAQADVETCALAEREAEREAERASGERRAAEEALRAEERALRALRAAADAAAARLEDARAALRASHHAPTLQALEEEKRVAEERLAKISEEERQAAAAEGGGGESPAALGEALRAAGERLRAARERCLALQNEVQTEQTEADEARRAAGALRPRLEARAAAREAAQRALGAAAAEVEAKRQGALQLSDRIENPREKGVVRRLLAEAEARLAAGLDASLKRATVGEQLVRVTRRLQQVRRTLASNRQLIDEIHNATEMHLKRCVAMQTDIVRNVQFSFKGILERRDLTGMLEVELGAGQLRVLCAPSGKRAGGTAALSGGERSYCTVALFIALWECVELPFFFLDEFDVCLDYVNRAEVMKLLQEHAAQRRGRQFVFLTPQDGFTVRESALIGICRLQK